MHGAAKHDIATVYLIEDDVLLKWAEDNDESPFAKPGMNQSGIGAKQRMLTDQLAGSFNRFEITFRNIPIRVCCIPFKLTFHVRDKIFGLADAHGLADFTLARTRSRMLLKSAFVSGVVGLSAASNSHASSSGVA